VPNLVSASLAEAGRPIAGEVAPVVAFLPIVLVAHVALQLGARRLGRRAYWVGGLLGVAVLLALLGRLAARSSHAPGVRVVALGMAVAVAVALALWMAGRALSRRDARSLGDDGHGDARSPTGAAPEPHADRGLARGAWLASGVTFALVASQAADGIITYLSVADPLGWLEHPVHEKVVVSALILEHAPHAFPLVKVGIALFVARALVRSAMAGPALYLLAVVVAYVGIGPAMYSAAHVL
jgi:hypothetical protein